MPTIFRVVFSLLCALSFCSNAFAQRTNSFYETRQQHDPNGTGVFFMGREIAHVCQGGEWLERPQREAEENTELMVDLLRLKPGETVADIGAGTGYVSRKLAKKVGPNGTVYAVEIQQEMLDALTNKAAQLGIHNIQPILGTAADPKLPANSVDTILMVDVYHELDQPYEMIEAMMQALKPNGRIVLVEFRAEDPKIPIKALHKMSEAQVKNEMAVHDLQWAETIEKLPWQHVVVFKKSESKDAETLQPIFDGKTFSGWKQHGDAKWEIVNGEIHGKTGGGGFGWLATAKPYGDFILELDVKIDSGNSGVQIRSHFENNGKMVGYQIEVDPTPRAWSGGLYEQGRRGWLNNLTNNEPARAAFKVGEWNKYRIEARGDSIRSWVNGVPAADYRDSMDLDGIIAFQVHSGKDCKVAFRNVRLADLGKSNWRKLWDGKAFAGWHKIGKGDWTIQDGILSGQHAKTETQFGHVVSDEVFGDFTARLMFKCLSGNSGFYFRSDETGPSGISGFQAEIDASKDVGGLYESHGRAWVSQPDPKLVQKAFKPQDWNQMTVSAHGGRICVDLNGHRISEVRDDPGRTKGHFALQLHGNQDVAVDFKDIEIIEKANANN